MQSPRPPLILIVDDESKIRRLLSKELEANGFDVICAGDGSQALDVFAQASPKPDLVLMDVMMPDMDGFECARRLPRTSDVPVIYLSARNEPSFKLRAFELGADDYITKPFLMDELIARIRAVMRRSQHTPEQSAQHEYENGPMHLSEASRSLRINDREVKLAESEYLLLLALIKHPGSVISHEQLLQSSRYRSHRQQDRRRHRRVHGRRYCRRCHRGSDRFHAACDHGRDYGSCRRSSGR